MIIGQAIKEEIGGNFTKKFLSRPMERIKKFALLSKMLKTQPKMRNYYRNPFFTLAMNEKCGRLKIYEDLLSKMSKKKMEDIKGKIRSFEPGQSWPVKIEFDFLYWLRTNNNIAQDKIRYEDFKDSNHDFRFEANSTEFNVELTSLGQSEPSKEIEEALYLIAEKLMDSISCYGKGLIIKVNTEMLVNEKGRMEKKYIYSYLTEEIEKIYSIIFMKTEGFCNIPEDLEVLKDILWDESSLKACYYLENKHWHERLNLFKNTKDGMEYLSNISLPSKLSIKSFDWKKDDRPIKYVILDADFDSDDKSREFLLGRLEERIRAKLGEKQLQGQRNPIIAVLFYDFVFHSYADNSYPVKTRFLQRIQERIHKVFKGNGNEDIKGILLIEDFKENFMKFIPNPNIKISQKLLNIIESFIPRNN